MVFKTEPLSQYFFSKDRGKLVNAITTLFFQASQVSTVVAWFEIEIQLLGKQYAGPFLEGDTYTAYFRGYFYSGLYRLGRHYLDSLSSEQRATRYAKLLSDSNTMTYLENNLCISKKCTFQNIKF